VSVYDLAFLWDICCNQNVHGAHAVRTPR
jgi:hypothetical protein